MLALMLLVTLQKMRYALAATLFAVAGAQLVADVRYPELVSLRQPWANVWAGPALPTGWAALPCTHAYTSFVGSADGVASALLVCSEGYFADAIQPSRTFASSIAIDGSFTFAGVNDGGLVTAIAASDAGSVYAMTCAANRCNFAPAANHAVGVVSDLVTFTGAVGRFMWLSGSNGTQALLLPASGAAATTVYRDSSSSYAALAYSSAKQEIALGNASKLVLLDASSASTATASAAIQFPLRRWLWVTNISTGAGGELDDVITALVYDDTPLPAPPATEVFLFDAAAAGAGAGFAAAGPFDFGMPGSAGAGGAGSGFSGNGTLYIGNPTALNIMYPDGTVARIDGMGGLPWGNITSIAVTQGPAGEATPGGDSRLVVIGTTMGVAIYDPYGTATVQNGPYGAWGQYPYAAAPPVVVGSGGNGNGRQLHSAGGLRSGGKRAGRNGQRSSGVGAAATTAAAAATPVSLYYQPAWRYLLGPRWLPCTPADTLSSVVRPKGVLAVPASVAAAAGLHLPVGRASEMQLGAPSASAGVIVAVTDAGASVLQTQMWHVADKATLMEALLPPHIVDGQINDCSYPSFGVAATCTWGPGANDGLWSSLVVASESFRYAVTGDADARDRAWQVFGGMKLLNDVTGITGLIARAAVDASFPPQPPADGWHNSSSLPGYQWMGDASSDEVAGHSLAYPIMASLVVGAGGNATEWATVTNVLRNLVSRMTLLAALCLPLNLSRGGRQCRITRRTRRRQSSLVVLLLVLASITCFVSLLSVCVSCPTGSLHHRQQLHSRGCNWAAHPLGPLGPGHHQRPARLVGRPWYQLVGNSGLAGWRAALFAAGII